MWRSLVKEDMAINRRGIMVQIGSVNLSAALNKKKFLFCIKVVMMHHYRSSSSNFVKY